MSRNSHEMRDEETGVSVVMAVILLLGLTFAATASVWVILSSIYTAPSPDALFTSKVWIKESENVIWLELTHKGGEPVSIQELRVRVEVWDNENNFTVLDSQSPSGYTVSMSVRGGGNVLRAGEIMDVEFALGQTPNVVSSSVSVTHLPAGLLLLWVPRTMVSTYVPTLPAPPPPPPSFAASFSFSPYLLATLDDEVRFWDESIGSIENWEWDFGDGTTDNVTNPNHQYAENGTYTVTLTVTADNGDKDNFPRIVQVVPPSHVEIRDGKLFVDNEHFTVKGVSYSPTPVGASAGAGYIWWDDSETYLNDFPMLRRMGANTVRTYNAGALVFPPPPGYGIYSDGGLGENVNDPLWYPWPGTAVTQSEVFGVGCPVDPEKSWKFDYSYAPENWGGVYTPWRHGETQDMSAYENLVFWVKGANGGEKFQVWVEDDAPSPNKYVVTAPSSWQEISIPLSYFGEDLTRIKVPWNIAFSDTVTGQDATVYIDFIRWVGPGDVGQAAPPEVKIYATKSALDYAYLNNLRVIMGFWVPYRYLDNTEVRENLKAGFVELVERFKNHPAVLMWSFGSEVDFWYAGPENNWYTLLQEAASAAKAVDPNHPVMTVNQEIEEIGREDNAATDDNLTALDIWGVDIYRGQSFGTLFSEYASKSSKPLLLAEWGSDAWDVKNSVENQAAQDTYIRQQWRETWMNLSHVGQHTQCIGGTVFEWSDEWWKAGAWDVQDTTGQWINPGYYDWDPANPGKPNMNEDWWGITKASLGTYEKTPRQAYYTLENWWLHGIEPTTTRVWDNVVVSPAPPARSSHALAYSGGDNLVLFGGRDWSNPSAPGTDSWGNFFDTWVYNVGENRWSNMNPSPHPAARGMHAMAYMGGNKVIMVGGWRGPSGVGWFPNDAWVYDLTTNTWTQQLGYNVLPALTLRADHAMAYDQLNNVVVLFGGNVPGTGLTNDTWEYDVSAGTWTQISPPTSPPARWKHAMAYAGNGKILLFGGSGAAGYLSDTWLYDAAANTWTQVFPASSPSSRWGHRMAYDSVNNKVALSGGYDGSYKSDAWLFDPSTNNWTQIPSGPSARRDHAMGYSPLSNRTVLFGGEVSDSVFVNDTWTNQGYTFSESDFRLSIDPIFENLMPGESVTATLSVDNLQAYGKIVTFSSIYSPPGVNVTFSSTSGTPPFTSTVTVQVDSMVAPGVFAIEIVGTSADGLENRSCSFFVTIGDPEVETKAIYNDAGFPQGADIWTWTGDTGAQFEDQYSDPSSPEGTHCFRTYAQENWVGWSIVLIHPSDHTINLSGYRELKFWVKTPENLRVMIQQENRWGAKQVAWISNYGWDGTNTWQEITIPVSAFSGINMSRIFMPFSITASTGATFYVDNVRWETGEGVAGPVNNPPVAGFSYSPSSPTTEDIIQFIDQSTDSDGTIVSWSWDFGDGTPISNLQNPTHQYTSANTYIVTLTVTDDDGATDSVSNGITVTSEPVGAMFQDFEPSNGTPGDYFYDAWQSNPSFETTIVYSGTRSVKMSAGSGGGTIGINAASPSGYIDLSSATSFSVWVYDTQGNNTIQLRLKDSDGDGGSGADNYFLWSAIPAQQNQWTKITWDLSSYPSVPNLDLNKIAWIELYEWNQGTYYFDDVRYVAPIANQPPTANFTFSPSAPDVGTIVQFTDQSTDSDGWIMSWSWNFGDGSTSTAQNPTHQYSSAGTYTVTLTVTDDDGATGSISRNVGVGAYVVYNDSGIPLGTDVRTWDSYRERGVGTGPATFNGDYTGESPPEGTKCFQTICNNGNTYAGWGVFVLGGQSENLIGYNYLRFWVKSTPGIKDISVGLESLPWSTTGFSIKEFGWDPVDNADQWVEIMIPRTRFSTIYFYGVTCPFKITCSPIGGGSGTFYIDNVRWVK